MTPPRAKTSSGRAIVAPLFGEQLRKLRGGQSRGQVCGALARFGLTVDRSTLLHYEAGTVAAPDPAVLWALGRHYGLDTIDELLTVLVMDRTGRALRSGIDIARPGFDLEQRRIAESFGGFAPAMRAALSTVIAGIRPMDVIAPPAAVPRRIKTMRPRA